MRIVVDEMPYSINSCPFAIKDEQGDFRCSLDRPTLDEYYYHCSMFHVGEDGQQVQDSESCDMLVTFKELLR